MSDYADLIKALRACNAPGGFCDSCPYHYGGIPCLDLNKNAADAIESMQAQMPKRGKWVAMALYMDDIGYDTPEEAVEAWNRMKEESK